MMRVASVIFLSLLCTGIFAQVKKVRLKVTPAVGATLFVDGEDRGDANGQTLKLGFNERKGITSYSLEIVLEGYHSDSYIIDLSDVSSQTINVELKRKFPKIENPPNLVVAIEKVVSGIEYATEVGANTRWKFRYDEQINLASKQSKMTAALTEIGLKSLNARSDDLFDVGKKKPKNADVLIAGRVEDLTLEYGTRSRYKSSITVNWQVFDRHNKEIILKKSVTSEYEFTSSIISEEFYNAIVNNYYVFLSDDTEFIDALSKVEIKPLVIEEAVVPIDTNDSNYIPDTNTSQVALLEEDVERIFISTVRLDKQEDFSDLVELAKNASVTVIIDQNRGHGSGVVVSANGYIVTNHHVTNGAKLIDVQFSNGIVLPADIITSSEKYDLALIKVRASGLTALPIINNPDDARQGDEVFVIGAPGNKELGQSVSKGIISAKRTLDGVKIIQTDTKISPGSSGSPLISEQGSIVGIINMKMVGEGVEGLSFAIDARYLQSVLGLQYE